MSASFARRLLVVFGVLSLLGWGLAAGPAPRPIRISNTYSTPPSRPNGPISVAAAEIHNYTHPQYGSPFRPGVPPINTSNVYADVGANGVRVDAWWRRPGRSTTWEYYGGQTSGGQTHGGQRLENVARFNPFYLPSGPVEILFRARGYSDNIHSILIP